MKGKIADKMFLMPNVKNLVKVFGQETIFVFSRNKDNTRWCFGIGTVMKIVKGKELDLVYINFGASYWREIIVITNHARRQIYTLKVGQLCEFFGWFTVNNNNYKDDTKFTFYAKGFNAWYVPRQMDIKNYDGEIPNMEDEQEQNMLNFLDSITEGEDDGQF